MKSSLLARAQSLPECLAAVASGLRQIRPGEWEFELHTMAGSHPLKSTARLEDEWLLLRAYRELEKAGKDRVGAASPWEMLQLNSEIPGIARVCLEASTQQPYIAAEIPVEEASDLRGEIHRACLGIEAAAGGLAAQGVVSRIALGHASSNASSDARPQVSPALAGAAGANSTRDLDLRERCHAAGWPFTERDGGGLAIELETSPSAGFHQARMAALPGDEGVAIHVDFPVALDLSPASREALGLFLLTAAGALRLVRATGRLVDGRATLGFEVRLGMADAFAVGQALGACSVACEQCGQEVKALQDERLAREYLAMRFGSDSTYSNSLSLSTLNAPFPGERSF